MPQEYPFANKPLGREVTGEKAEPDYPYTHHLFSKEERESIPEDTLITTKTPTGWVTKARNGYWRFDADAPPSGQGPPGPLQRVLKEIEERKRREVERRGRAKDPESSAEKPRAEKQRRDVAPAATGEARAAGIADDIRQLVLRSRVSGSKKSAMLSQLRLWTYFDSEEQRQEPRTSEVLHTGKFKPVRSSDEYDRGSSEDCDSCDGDYDEAAAQAAYNASVNNGR